METVVKFKKIVPLLIILFLMILQIKVYSQNSNIIDSLSIHPKDTSLTKASLEENPVLYIQQNLNKLGYEVLENNIFDISTKKAFTHFLKTYGFPVPMMRHDRIKELFEQVAKEKNK